MELLLDYQIWVSFLTLTSLEIILGIDNVVFIALLVQNLPAEAREKARITGLTLALAMRILLLLGVAWIISLSEPWLNIFGQALSGKDILMLLGGGFLIYKGTNSIHDEVTGEFKEEAANKNLTNFTGVVLQVVFIDIIFSFDSVMTAVGLTKVIPVIIAAMSVAMLVMIFSSGYIARFIERFPTLKVLALAFIMLIGVFLVAEGLGFHVPKGYIYFAMSFSLGVEVLNLLAQRRKLKKKAAEASK